MPNQINELVRDVCTSIQNFTRAPNKSERESVSQMIVERFPFLKAPQLSRDTKPWGSIEVKIMYRFKKLQRRKSDKDTEAVRGNGGRPAKQKKLLWELVPADDESNITGDVITELQQEWKRSRVDHSKVKELMEKTYSKRREMIITDRIPLQDVVKAFPPIKNMLYIKSDFARLMGNGELASQMKTNFKDVWSRNIFEHAKSLKKYEKLFNDMNEAIDSGCDEAECQERTALKLVSCILKPPNKKGQNNGHDEAVLRIIPAEGQHALDEGIRTSSQPCIVVSDNLYHGNLMYVVVDGMALCHITTGKISDAIVALMATYFLYNISYQKGKNAYKFLELTLMGLTYEKVPVSVETIIGVLSTYSKK